MAMNQSFKDIVARPKVAVGLIALGMALIALNDAMIKVMGERLPLYQIMFLRALPATALVFLIPGILREVRGLTFRSSLLLLTRAAVLMVAMVLYFLGLSELPLGEATAIFFTAPLLISLFSVPVLGERLGPWRIAAVMMGMVGVLLIAQPAFLLNLVQDSASPIKTGSWAILFPLASACFYAAFQLLTRWLRASASAGAMASFQQMTYLGVGLVGGVAIWLISPTVPDHGAGQFLLREWQAPIARDYLWLVLCGLITVFLSLASANAYRNAEATYVAPFEYSALPFAVLWGGVIWGDWPNLWSSLGILLIFGGGLLVLFRENRRDVDVASSSPMPATAAAAQDRWEDEDEQR